MTAAAAAGLAATGLAATGLAATGFEAGALAATGLAATGFEAGALAATGFAAGLAAGFADELGVVVAFLVLVTIFDWLAAFDKFGDEAFPPVLTFSGTGCCIPAGFAPAFAEALAAAEVVLTLTAELAGLTPRAASFEAAAPERPLPPPPAFAAAFAAGTFTPLDIVSWFLVSWFLVP